MKVKPKNIYDIVFFDGNNIEDVTNLMKTNNMEILKVERDPNEYTLVYYIDVCKEAKMFEMNNNVYFWVDEMGECNFCSKEYFKDKFEVIE